MEEILTTFGHHRDYVFLRKLPALFGNQLSLAT